ncbi:MAG TPA: sigma 54-interacting transcriptional regulator [Thermoanaerobaculaceae bacterium]|nr:sigma 54-interacting transcriptional regulator [Thermoanaerobaculaceae bacterium]HPS77404.1 sigma 54-interacting transcriptional regulator [Thermoanaerobaculaceae bacterium]
MIDLFKARLAEKIQQKDIALAMLVDRGGRIRWHAGRPVTGRTVEEGIGFSRTHLRQALDARSDVASRDVMISATELGFPQSARFLLVRSLFVHPVSDELLLYVDSGNDTFGPDDLEFFRRSGSELRALLADLRGIEEGAGGISGSSAATRRIRALALAYALEEDPVLLLGETGVGKSHIAQLIHRFSGRPGQLIVVDTPAIPEHLIESELFGHCRGAFTGAVRDKKGLVDAAQDGTLFLDEIAEVPQPFQAKLLRFIDGQRYRPVGDARERPAAVRIIAATNRDLPEEIARQRFREDLYFRLNVLTIEIPPLRQRREDLRSLVAEYERFLRGKTLGPGFWEVVEAHDWPGNVRELVNVLKRAGIQLPGATVGSEIAELLPRRAGRAAGEAQISPALTRVKEQLAGGGQFWDTAWAAFLERDLNRAELRGLLAEHFAASQHNLKELARRLHVPDVDYPRFVSALHKYRVHPGR